ncbi:MAG TPA: hypothetical protein VGN75_16135 [Kaistia sp.]|jgi:hypothetical protein|nr:hypothetical protein [Kaistia sp.]
MRISIAKDLAELKAAAEAGIIERAQQERARHATPGKDAVYLEKRREAERYLASGEPADLAGYNWLRREVGTTAPSAPELARLWIRLGDYWSREKGPEIEGREQAAKAAVRAATTPAEIEAAEALMSNPG